MILKNKPWKNTIMRGIQIFKWCRGSGGWDGGGGSNEWGEEDFVEGGRGGIAKDEKKHTCRKLIKRQYI